METYLANSQTALVAQVVVGRTWFNATAVFGSRV